MTLGEKLQRAREARAKSAEEVAGRMRVSTTAVYQWERNEHVPRMPKLRQLAELYQVDLAWLLNDNDEPPPVPAAAVKPPPAVAQRAVPVISYVQAGEWTDVPDDAGHELIYTDVPVSAESFALKVEGLSMVPDFAPGDKIIVDPRVRPTPGAFVVAQIDSEPKATLKRYRDRGRDGIELSPSNPDYPTLRIDADNPGRIVGTVVEKRSYLVAP